MSELLIDQIEIEHIRVGDKVEYISIDQSVIITLI